MRDRLTPKGKSSALALLVAASVGLPACGDEDEDKQATATPKTVAVAATETGNRTRLSVPKSVPAGLVTVELTNTGKAFHEAQLIRLDPGHTPEEALEVIAAEGAPSPGWIQAAGGTGPAPPGWLELGDTAVAPGQLHRLRRPVSERGPGRETWRRHLRGRGRARRRRAA